MGLLKKTPLRIGVGRHLLGTRLIILDRKFLYLNKFFLLLKQAKGQKRKRWGGGEGRERRREENNIK